jgi:hypothetical protein
MGLSKVSLAPSCAFLFSFLCEGGLTPLMLFVMLRLPTPPVTLASRGYAGNAMGFWRLNLVPHGNSVCPRKVAPQAPRGRVRTSLTLSSALHPWQRQPWRWRTPPWTCPYASRATTRREKRPGGRTRRRACRKACIPFDISSSDATMSWNGMFLSEKKSSIRQPA